MAREPAENELLCGDSHFLVKKLRREIGPIWPHQCVQLRIQAKALECFDVPQRLEYRAIDLILQVNISLKAVVELEPNYIAPN